MTHMHITDTIVAIHEFWKGLSKVQVWQNLV